MTLGERLVRFLRLIEPKDKLIKVKSWWPEWDSKYHCPLWPCMLYDSASGGRMTGWPLWDRARWRKVLRLPDPPGPPYPQNGM